MRTAFFLTLAFGCALAFQPYVWDDSTCPEDKENRETYIVQGETAAEGEFPYMLSVTTEAENKHYCGASILAKNWALTAAHCCEVMRRRTFYIKSGTNSLTSGGNIHKIERYIIHKNYSIINSWRNDICLLKVSDPFEYGPLVQQVTLPPQNMPVTGGELVNITGWGLTIPDVPSTPELLQLGRNFVTLSRERCADITNKKHEAFLCVVGGRSGQGMCNGDSGSPLVINGVQVGIASWVYHPCGCGKPDFYARVPIFIDWIKEKLGPDASELKIAE